jgi:hypothetical protein
MPVTVREFCIARCGGLPVTILDELRTGKSRSLAEQILVDERKHASGREGVSDILHGAVSRSDDAGDRRRLLDLRRRLFNARPVRDELVSCAQRLLAADELQLVEESVSTVGRLQEGGRLLEPTFSREIATARSRFRRAIDDPDFQKGVLLSSTSLAANMATYSSENAGKPSSRQLQVERGLLRYFTRASAKATPFGTFCAVIEGRLNATAMTRALTLNLSGNIREKRSRVRPNKTLYRVLWRHALSCPSVRLRTAVALNPTLERQNGRMRFLTVAGGVETFQRVTRNEALDLVVQMLSARDAAPVAAVAETLAASPEIETSLDEAQEFLLQLAGIGLLRFHSGIPDQEADWIEPLRARLEHIDDDGAGAALIIGLLSTLSLETTRYATAALDERRNIEHRVKAAITDTLSRANIKASDFDGRHLFEDCTADASLQVDLDSAGLAALERAGELLFELERLSFYRSEMEGMRQFFARNYTAHGQTRVPLLAFYEDFYRDHYKELADKRARLRKPPATEGNEEREKREAAMRDATNPFGLESIEARRMANGRLFRLIQERWANDPTAPVIDLTLDEIRRIIDRSGSPRARWGSLATFCQLTLSEDGRAQVLVPSAHGVPGYGKYFSRFLYLLPDASRERVRAENRALADSGSVLAEVQNDGSFNGNLHPPLVDYEIPYPTSDGSGMPSVNVSALVVELDPHSEGRLRLLETTTGREVVPLDLGFLNPMRRPPLFQLLTRFTPCGCPFTIPMPWTSTTATSTARVPDECIQRPRITVDGSIVIARRQWNFAAGAVPAPTSGESEALYFLRVSRWVERFGLPTRAYIRTAAGWHESAAESQRTPAAEQRHSPDSFKPQYVDFASPLLLQLFARAAGALRGKGLLVEECLPAMDELPARGGERYAYELVVQFDMREATPNANH